MTIKRLRTTTVLLLAALGLSACGTVHSGGAYHRRQAGEIQYVSRGTIVATRDVAIEGERSGLGTIGGGVIGGVGGSMIGRGGRAHIAGAAAGAILGAVIGSLAENHLSRTTATEFTVREESGQLVAVVQANEEGLMPGERVVVLRGSRARVVRDLAPSPSPAPMIFSPPVGGPPPQPYPAPPAYAVPPVVGSPAPSVPAPPAAAAPAPQPPATIGAPRLPPAVGVAPPPDGKPSEQPRPQGGPQPVDAETSDEDAPQILTGPLPREPVTQSPGPGGARAQPLRS
ncbi:MAG: hypothetical protein JNK67_32130 [Alphaproteobacteria bacterium]|nr:hypothetical protein [Alphaproteobacteria bacterium]